jgi:hypothetical protein
LLEQKVDFRQIYHFNQLDVAVDSADPGFISNLNTLAREQGKQWLLARPCTKLPIPERISFTTMLLSEGRYHIYKSCKNTFDFFPLYQAAMYI